MVCVLQCSQQCSARHLDTIDLELFIIFLGWNVCNFIGLIMNILFKNIISSVQITMTYHLSQMLNLLVFEQSLQLCW